MKKFKLRKLRENNHGALAFFVAFLLISVVLIFFFVVATPFLMAINAGFYEASENILDTGESILPGIQNVTIRGELQDAFNAAKSTTTENVNILSFFYQYSWIFILVITVMAVFILARRTVETRTII